MKIKEVRAIEIELKPPRITEPRHPGKPHSKTLHRPLDRYEKFRGDRSGSADWKRVACIVTADDGTWGLGLGAFSGPLLPLINDQFASLLVGEDCLATEKLWDFMVSSTAAFGGTGIASYAISAVDTALWDLKGKILQRPVYELLGGPQKDKIFCYASGFDTEWYMELGFKATKLFTPWGAEDGIDGLKKIEEMVATTRELIGDEIELCLDCWLSQDVEHLARLAEMLRPYRLKWMEDYLPFDDMAGYREARRRIPWQTLASGEHWYLPRTFANAINDRLVDILQPDVLWCGGITAAVRICSLAEAAGVSVIAHGGMNYPYGQHLSFAMPAIVWGERSESVSPPGVPLEEMSLLPGTPAIENGYLVPSDAPGFGIEVDLDWLAGVAV